MVDIWNPLYQQDLHRTYSYLQSLAERSKNNILVIGATGLIGSFLVDALIGFNEENEATFKVYAMGRSIERLKRRFAYCNKDYLSFVEHDIHDALNPSNCYDVIFHLASNADPGTYRKYPYETITTNVQGTINVIEYARAHRQTEVLFTSTMEVYGEIHRKALQEEDYGAIDFHRIRSGYPESKRTAELLYKSAVQEYGISAKIARMGYIYGPTMTDNDSKIIAEFLRNKMNYKQIELKSSGTQNRAYCYVADAVTGMLTVLEHGINGEAINVADANSVLSLQELAVLFGAEKKTTVYGTGEVYDTVLDTKKLQHLGWQATTNIRDGIQKSLACMIKGEE